MLQQLANLPANSAHRVVLEGPVGAMEALVEVPSRLQGIAVVGHPQPLLGGSASHKIPQFLARGLSAQGWLAVRPNFRGVGGSAGVHDASLGESEDMVWLVEQLREAYPGLPLALVGFSFGAYVLGRAAGTLARRGAPASAVVLAGAPVGTVEAGRHYEPLQLSPGTLVIHGERDDEVKLQAVLDWCGAQGQGVMVIPGADHFFAGKLPVLRALALQHLQPYLREPSG
jgi:alpha/beta superfamily hydrolase